MTDKSQTTAIDPDKVEWVVNDNAELGVKIGQAAVVDDLAAAAEWILSGAENARIQPA